MLGTFMEKNVHGKFKEIQKKRKNPESVIFKNSEKSIELQQELF